MLMTSLLAGRRLAAAGCRRLSSGQEFDLLVIGGGSGGLACAKEAADLGARVCVLDYVEPSPRGTRWGLGGTCVNVGCVPKKLMHLAALCGETIRQAEAYGWQMEQTPRHDWSRLSTNVQQHIRSLNFGHRGQLMLRGVEYLNMRGRFTDSRTVLAENPKTGKTRELTSANFVVAVGGRPHVPTEVPGLAELSITSDDLFWLPDSPGRTLVIGGSYVALECAGLLRGLGLDASLLVRSICLRGFDRQMAGLVTDFMSADSGLPIRWGCRPTRATRDPNGAVRVEWENSEGRVESDAFGTVLCATGRRPCTAGLGLELAGVRLTPEGRVIGGSDGEQERTEAGHVYAIGDVLEGGIELTPVAVRAGKLLAKRLFAGSRAQMRYDCSPTTVFTPLEYSCVGLSEEAAVERYGESGIEVYHSVYTPYEYILPHRDQSQCYIKAVCSVGELASERQLLGLHVTGPNSGELLQGFAALVCRGATFADLVESAVGIHPTTAEEVTKLWITKRSGVSPNVTGC